MEFDKKNNAIIIDLNDILDSVPVGRAIDPYDLPEILNECALVDVIDHYGIDEILAKIGHKDCLETIGKDAAMEYFDLVDLGPDATFKKED